MSTLFRSKDCATMPKFPLAQTFRRLFAALLAFSALACGTPASAAKWIEFRAASAPPTPFQIARAEELGEVLKPKQGELVRGKLFLPEGNSPAAAVILMEGCRGLRPFLSSWAKAISNWGYVALLVDSFGLRDDEEACTVQALRQESSQIVYHAFGALDFLGRQEFVDPERIAVMGWSTGGFLQTILEDGAQSLFERSFKAAVAFYPFCRLASSGRFTAPLLILVGGKDDWSLAADCERMTESSQNGRFPTTLFVYPDAYNAFDDPGAGDPHEENYANLFKNPARGVTIGYNPAARADAMTKVKDFLELHLAN